MTDSVRRMRDGVTEGLSNTSRVTVHRPSQESPQEAGSAAPALAKPWLWGLRPCKGGKIIKMPMGRARDLLAHRGGQGHLPKPGAPLCTSSLNSLRVTFSLLLTLNAGGSSSRQKSLNDYFSVSDLLTKHILTGNFCQLFELLQNMYHQRILREMKLNGSSLCAPFQNNSSFQKQKWPIST